MFRLLPLWLRELPTQSPARSSRPLRLETCQRLVFEWPPNRLSAHYHGSFFARLLLLLGPPRPDPLPCRGSALPALRVASRPRASPPARPPAPSDLDTPYYDMNTNYSVY